MITLPPSDSCLSECFTVVSFCYQRSRRLTRASSSETPPGSRTDATLASTYHHSRALTVMKKTKQIVLFDENDADLKEVLEDMGILQLILELPEDEQGKALAEILPALRAFLEALADSPANITAGAAHTSIRAGSYHFQFKKSLYVAATVAAGVTVFAVFGPVTAAAGTAVALSPQIVALLRGVNDVLVKLDSAEVAVYEAVAGVEMKKRPRPLTEKGASLAELRDWYKRRGASTPKRLETILDILVNQRRALRSRVGANDEIYYSIIP